MATTRTCPRCGSSFSGILDRCPNDRTPLLLLDDGPMDAGGAGRDERMVGDELAAMDAFDPDGFSNTMDTRSLRAQGRRRLMFAAAIVVLAGTGAVLWGVRRNPMPEASRPAPGAVSNPSAVPTSPPAVRPAVQTSPAARSAVPAPAVGSARSAVQIAMPAPPAAKPLLSSPGKAPTRSRRAAEEFSYHAPAGFPSDPMPVVPSEPPPPIPDSPAPAAPAVVPSPVVPANPAGDPKALVQEAQQAWLRKHYASAIEKARAALELSPDQPLAYQIIGACSCVLQNTEDAQQAASHLDPARKKLVRTLCEKNGVILNSD